MTSMLNERAEYLLKGLIERHIADGQPVGSKTLSRMKGVDVSPATVRHVLADLEAMGLLVSPHVSAGRIPTERGYRVFVDRLVTIKPLEQEALVEMEHSLQPDSPKKMACSASSLLSELTQCAGVVVTPQRTEMGFHQIEFLRLSKRRILMILVTLTGDVQNYLLHTERDYQPAELLEASNFINQHYHGQSLSIILKALADELRRLRTDISELMSSVIRLGQEPMASDIVVRGGARLLERIDFPDDMAKLRQLFHAFEHKTELLQLLHQTNLAPGVNIFIGNESGMTPLGECSVVTAPYHINGQVVGTLGVIGPIRIPYQRVIPIVDLTAKMVSSALSFQGN